MSPARQASGDNGGGTEEGKEKVATLVPGNGRDGFRKGGGPPSKRWAKESVR
jgi:hypothetical protein